MEQFGALNEKYVVTSVIGSGASSVVLAASQRKDAKEVAVKVVPRHRRSLIEAEIDILANAGCEKMIRLIEVIDDGDKTYLVMEYMACGDLWGQVNRRASALEEQEVLEIAESILEALVHMHARGIAHRDIKPENIMIALDGTAKLADFGLARWRKNPLVGHFSTDLVGTPHYLAPQVAARKPYVPEQADMWSFGVVLYFLVTGTLPFEACSLGSLYKAIRTQKVCFDGAAWDAVSKETRDVVEALLSRDASKRPSAARCLEMIRRIINGDANEQEAAATSEFACDDSFGNLGGFLGAFMGAFNLGKPTPTALMA